MVFVLFNIRGLVFGGFYMHWKVFIIPACLCLFLFADEAFSQSCSAPSGSICATAGTSTSNIQISSNNITGFTSRSVHRFKGTGTPTCQPNIQSCNMWSFVGNMGATATITDHGYSPNNHIAGTKYRYRICGHYVGGSTCNVTSDAFGWKAPPPAPVSLMPSQALPSGGVSFPDQIRVLYTLSDLPQVRLDMYRSTNPGSQCAGSPIATNLAGAVYNDNHSSLIPGTYYYYSGRQRPAANGSFTGPCLGNGNPGWKAMSAPVGQAAVDGVNVQISWINPQGVFNNGVQQYIIFRRTSNNSNVCNNPETVVGTAGGSSSSLVDSSVNPGTTYYYGIKSVGANKESPCSATFSVTVPSFSLSGKVQKSPGTSGLSGATVSIPGVGSTTTSSNGNFSFNGLAGGGTSYTIAATPPGSSGSSISNSPQSVSIFSSNVSNINFHAHCPSGQIWSGNQCVCPGGQVWNGSQCQCPSGQNWNGSQCVTCSGGQYWNGSQCQCPAGQNWNGSQCISCTGGQSWNGSQCACPAGQNWDGFQCVSCTGGQEWDGTQCACPSGQNWDGSSCVYPPLVINQHPDGTAVFQGQSALFSVTHSGGTPPLTYQWKKNGININGATAQSYETPAVDLADNGAQFSVKITDSFNQYVESNQAHLTVYGPPVISGHPENKSVYIAQSASFSVAASGEDLSYQWQKNGSDIPGATSSSYITPLVTLDDNSFQYRCRVTNPAGSVYSSSAQLTVLSNTMQVSVTKATGGGLEGGIVTVNGNAAGVTNSSGILVLSSLAAGNYNVQVEKDEVQIAPASINVNVVNGTQAEASFVASCQGGYAFSGSNCVEVTSAPIYPKGYCVQELSDGMYRGYFGYKSNSLVPVVIAVDDEGDDQNFFSPGDIDRGQDTVFYSEENKGTFSVVFDGSPLTWTIVVAGNHEHTATLSSESDACLPVEPKAECISIAAQGGLLAHYGYLNKNQFESPFIIEVGGDNFFDPDPIDRGQKTEFLSGLVQNAFSVPFDGSSLSWTLQEDTVTLSSLSDVCPPGNSPPVAISPSNYGAACDGYETKIFLNGAASYDPDQNPISFYWSSDCANSYFNSTTLANPILFLSDPGEGIAANCSVTLTVSDGLASDSVTAAIDVPACNIDCFGNPNGSSQVDACGICGGNGTSCLDCEGTPFGTLVFDQCGVCGGGNECLDCAGQAFGSSTLDQCGVCAGDGVSCLGCVEINVSESLDVITRDFLTLHSIQRRAWRRASRIAAKFDPNNRRIRRRAKNQIQRGDFRYNELQLDFHASLAPVVVKCTHEEFCVEVDNGAVIDEYDKVSLFFQRSTRRARRTLGVNANRTDRRRVQRARKMRESVLEHLSNLPRLSSSCSTE